MAAIGFGLVKKGDGALADTFNAAAGSLDGVGSTGVKTSLELVSQKELNRSNKEIEKAIKSFDKQVKKHEAKINNPEKNTNYWSSLTKNEQNNLIQNKWPKEIQGFKEQQNVLRGILNARK